MPSLEGHWVVFQTYKGNQNPHIGDLVESTGHLFCKVACSRYDLLSEMISTMHAHETQGVTPQESLYITSGVGEIPLHISIRQSHRCLTITPGLQEMTQETNDYTIITSSVQEIPTSTEFMK
jgi:hypothetical protein